jgi:formamidopyrimidine-DNA glycosylase
MPTSRTGPGGHYGGIYHAEPAAAATAGALGYDTGRMPELPEVETVARGLAAVLPGRRVLSIRLGKTDFIGDPARLERELPGACFRAVTRCGKFLLLGVEPGNGTSRAMCLLVHLGMTGQLTTCPAAKPAAPHTHIVCTLDDGRELRYVDTRRFGRVALLNEAEWPAALQSLGVDPLETSAEEFCRRLAGRRARIKALLLDQHVFRGLGNIYTDEALWRARIHPARLASRLGRTQILHLHRAVRRVLQEAIRLGGSSISDYVGADGARGWFQLRHLVYGREGKPCRRCDARIRRIVVAGRSSYFCPRCQPSPRSGRRISGGPIN